MIMDDSAPDFPLPVALWKIGGYDRMTRKTDHDPVLKEKQDGTIAIQVIGYPNQSQSLDGEDGE